MLDILEETGEPLLPLTEHILHEQASARNRTCTELMEASDAVPVPYLKGSVAGVLNILKAVEVRAHTGSVLLSVLMIATTSKLSQTMAT